MTNDRIGIVASIQYSKFLVNFEGAQLMLEVGRNLPYRMQKDLVVGDRVMLSRKDGEWRITDQQARTSFLSRMKGIPRRPREQVIAANIDLAVIVAAKRNPTFHPGLIDRYLMICHHGGVEPVLCINKMDLEGEADELSVLAWYHERLEIPIIFTSAEGAAGLDSLKQAIRGKTAVLVGNSGVGKTSLVNVLLPELELKVNDVDRYGDGRHTTTYSGLYEWEPGSFIIDTPGIRSLEVSQIPKEMLPFGFPEFDAYAKQCAFSNCSHDHEPDCAVMAAVEAGEIEISRYESYLSILAGYAR